MDWAASGIINTFDYELVNCVSLASTGERLTGVTGCSIKEAYYADTRASATLELDGSRIPEGMAVRIWHTATLGDEQVTEALGTFMVDEDSPTISYGRMSGEVSLVSMLARYSTDLIGTDMGVSDVPVASWFEAAVADGFGVPLVMPGIDRSKTFSPWVWEFAKSTLWALNQAADAVGGRIDVDGYGRTVLSPYGVPSSRADTFEITPNVLEVGITRTDGDRVNRVVVCYEPSDGDPIYADVRVDAAHPWHPSKIGRWYTKDYNESQPEDPTQAGIERLARRYLAVNSDASRKWEGKGLYLPVKCGEVGRLTYSDADGGESVNARVMLQQKSYKLDAAMETSYVLDEVGEVNG